MSMNSTIRNMIKKVIGIYTGTDVNEALMTIFTEVNFSPLTALALARSLSTTLNKNMLGDVNNQMFRDTPVDYLYMLPPKLYDLISKNAIIRFDVASNKLISYSTTINKSDFSEFAALVDNYLRRYLLSKTEDRIAAIMQNSIQLRTLTDFQLKKLPYDDYALFDEQVEEVYKESSTQNSPPRETFVNDIAKSISDYGSSMAGVGTKADLLTELFKQHLVNVSDNTNVWNSIKSETQAGSKKLAELVGKWNSTIQKYKNEPSVQVINLTLFRTFSYLSNPIIEKLYGQNNK